MATKEIPQYLTTEQVGDILGFSTQRIREMIHRGDLPAYKINKEFRIKRSDFEAYVESLKVEGYKSQRGEVGHG